MQRGGRPGCSGGLPRANGRKRRVCRWRRQAQNPSGRLRQSQGTSLSDLERIYQRKKEANKELSTLLAATGTSLTSLHGVGPSGAARLLAEVGQVTRFPTRAHFASWNGTAPIDASSGDQVRHRLSRAGNRQINRVLHIMAVVQLRNPTHGRACYDRKVAAGKTPTEAMRALTPARPACTPAPALRRSHFPGPPSTTLCHQSQLILPVVPGALHPPRTAAAVKRSLLDDGEDRGMLTRPG
jgi:transposase